MSDKKDIHQFLFANLIDLIKREEELPKYKKEMGETVYQQDLEITREWQRCIKWLMRINNWGNK